ncbi:MAG TPA: rhomboid family intramembrane serine protease [Lysobacter sp.]|nr:rhomboid family intramembrane serine protease [Lysobacter sp.]
MHLPQAELPPDTPAQRRADRRRLLGAFNASLAGALLLCLCHAAQQGFDVGPWTVIPGSVAGLRGILTAPLLHGSGTHLLMNALSLLALGTLAGIAYPKATLRALPLLWIGSGLGAWWLGEPGSHHLGASGVIHGLGFLLFTLGLLRRDRAAVATGMLAFAFFGGMLLTIFPRELDVSWQSHLGGALAGVLSAFLFRRSDPALPRRRYSWELEEELAARQSADERDTFEPPSPADVPVRWHREDAPRGVVLRFPERRD